MWARWELGRLARQFTSRFGWVGWALLLCAAASVLTWSVGQQQADELTALQAQWQSLSAANARQATGQAPGQAPLQTAELATPAPVSQPSAKSRLQAFEDSLPPYENVPDLIQELLTFADEQKLVIQRGDYLAQPDPTGSFLRYRMTWPVKGPAPAVYRFLQSSLRAQKTLALESMQLRRDGVDNPTIEARIQWVLLTRRPTNPVGQP